MEGLPEELHREILAHLWAPRDLVNAIKAAPCFRTAARAHALWKRRATREFGVSSEELWDGWTWRDFYQRVLYPFRGLLGWWQRNLRFYSGVIQVKVLAKSTLRKRPKSGLEVESTGLNGYVMECPVDDLFLTSPGPIPIVLPPGFSEDRLPPLCKPERVVKAGGIRAREPHLLVVKDADWSRESREHWRPRLLFSLTHVGRKLRLYCYQSDVGIADAIGHLSCHAKPNPKEECEYEAQGQSLVCTACNTTVLSLTDKGFSFHCQHEEAHHLFPANRIPIIDHYWPVEHGVRVSQTAGFGPLLQPLLNHEHYGLRLAKFTTLLGCLSSWNLEHLYVPQFIPHIFRDVFGEWEETDIPKPGLYFGSYSGHGMEVISFQYARTASGRPVFEGHKITGDPNVPAKELSVRAFLDEPVILRPGDQASLRDVQTALQEYKDSVRPAPSPASPEFRLQPFSWVPDLHSRPSGFEPLSCFGRFMGEGQIAGTDFVNPEYTELVLSLLGPGHLGVLWTHLSAHSLYYRASAQPPPTVQCDTL